MQGNKFVIWIVAIALFMETLDATILTIAVPAIAKSIHTDPISLKLALTSYLLSLAIFIPISGWLAEKYGAKIIFTTAVVIFILSSLFCGFSANLLELVIFRILQGIGGALMMPVARIILLKSFPKAELVKATNYATIPSLLGPALGPVIGGILVNYLSWRWIFFVNIPFGLIAIIISFIMIQNVKDHSIHKLDLWGFILFGLGLSFFSFALEAFSQEMLETKKIIWLLIVSLILLITYFYTSKNKKNPIFDLSLFKLPTFSITVSGSFIVRLAIGAMLFLWPLMLQLSLNYNILKAGFIMLGFAVAMIIMKFQVKKILKLMGFKYVLLLNGVLLAFTTCLFVWTTSNTPIYIFAILIFVDGLFISLQYSCMNVLSYVDLKSNEISKGTSIGATVQQLSMSFGIGLAALLLKINVGVDYHETMHINLDVFHKAFFIISIIPFISTLDFFRLKKNDGAEASGKYYGKNVE